MVPVLPVLGRLGEEVASILKPSAFSLEPSALNLEPLAFSTSVTSQNLAERIRKANEVDSDEPSNRAERLYKTIVERSCREVCADTNLERFMSSLSVKVNESMAMKLFTMHWEKFSYHGCSGLADDCRAAYAFGVKAWESTLSAGQLDVYSALASKLNKNMNRQFAFRLMHSLSGEARSNSPVGYFYLSQKELADRCDSPHAMSARRLLDQFIAWKIIQVDRTGTKSEPGKRGIATLYKWNLKP